jgi:hypothetical protein
MRLKQLILELETDQPTKVAELAPLDADTPLDSDSNAAVSEATAEIEKIEKARKLRNKKAREKREKKKAATIKAIQAKAKKKAYDHNRYIQKQLAKLNKAISDEYNEAYEKLSAEANSFAWHSIPYIIPNIVDRNIGSLKNEFVSDYQQVRASIKDPDALIPISAPMKAKMKEWNDVEVPIHKAAIKRAKEIEAEGNPPVAVVNNTIIAPDNLMSNKDNDGRTYYQAPDGIYPELAKMYATAWDAKCEEILSDEEWMGEILDKLAKKYFDDRESRLPSNEPATKGLDKLTTEVKEILVQAAKEALKVQKASKTYTDVVNLIDKVKAEIKKAHDTASATKIGAVDTRKGVVHALNLLLTTHKGRIVTAKKALATAKEKTDSVIASAEEAITAYKAKTIKVTAYDKAIKAYATNVKTLNMNKLKIKNNEAAVKLIEAALSNLKENLFTGTLKSLLK